MWTDNQTKILLTVLTGLFFLMPAYGEETRQILPAPQLISPEDLAEFLPVPFDPPDVLLSWAPVPGAVSYVLYLHAMNEVDIEIEVDDGTSTEVFADIPETYFWKVRAVGPGGTLGQWSKERRFIRLEVAPTRTPTPRPTGTPDIDVSDDGVINGLDSFLVASRWENRSTLYDLTRDDVITEEDFIAFLAVWRNRELIQPGPTPVLPPPRLVEPTEGMVIHRSQIIEGGSPGAAVISQASGVIFSWTEVEGADRYDLRFEGPAGGSLGEYVQKDLTATQLLVRLPIQLIQEELGTYLWQVRSGTSALPEEEAYSFYSDPRKFIITDQLSPTPTPTRIPLTADINLDGRILPMDLFMFSLAWRAGQADPEYIEAADQDRSGEVAPEDLIRFVESQQKRDEEFIEPPALLFPDDGATITRQQANDPALIFSAVEGAGEYKIELINPYSSRIIRYISESGKGAYSFADETGESVGFFGSWKWRVQTIGQGTGRVSPWSEQRTFTVTGVQN